MNIFPKVNRALGNSPRINKVENVSTRKGRTLGRRLIITVAIGLIMAFVGPVVSGAASRPGVKTPLQHGLEFYKGKTVTIVGGAVAGVTDIEARALAQLLSSYLHATMNVVDANASNGIPGQDAIAAAPPTGLEFGYVDIGSLAEEVFTNTPGYNFNPGRLSWIVGSLGNPTAIVASPSSPYTTFAALKDAATPARVLANIPGTGSTAMQILFGLLGIHVQLVTGYASQSLTQVGFQRGDGPVAIMTYTHDAQVVSAGLAVPIAIAVTPGVGVANRQYFVNTPTFTELLNKYLPKKATKKELEAAQVLKSFVELGQPLLTQARVPADRLLALRTAVKWAERQSLFEQQALAAGGNPKYINPVQAKAQFNVMIAGESSVKCYLSPTSTGSCVAS